jgi:hypothetical protein
MSRPHRSSSPRPSRAVAFLAVLSLAAYAVVGLAAPQGAFAAGSASVSITPGSPSTDSGIATTFTAS